jgi:hypothetical protein
MLLVLVLGLDKSTVSKLLGGYQLFAQQTLESLPSHTLPSIGSITRIFAQP